MSIRYWDKTYTTIQGWLITEQPERSGGFSIKDVQPHKRVFQVITDKIGGYIPGPIAVLKEVWNATGLRPGVGYSYGTGEYEPTFLCSTVTATQSGGKDNPHIYTVECTFEYFQFNGTSIDDPLSIVPIPVWRTEEVEIPLDIDFNNVAIRNSANTRFSPPLTHTISRSVLIIERNEATYSEALASVWRNKCNSLEWNGYAPKTVHCRHISADPQVDPNIGLYFKVRYEFEFYNPWITDPDMATRRILDAGWQDINGLTIFGADGMQPSDIPFLDGSGAKLDSSADPVFLDFQVRDTVDFTDLNIVLS